MEVFLPVISQDGKRVSFQGSDQLVYVVDMNGGPARKVEIKGAFIGNLSPDASSMILTVWVEGKHLGDQNIFQLESLDLRTGKVSIIPNSEGVGGPFWVSQNMIVGDAESTRFMAFDFGTSRWTHLYSGSIVNYMPSPDGKYLYFTTGGGQPQAMRIRLADRRVETITSLKNLRRVVNGGTQISVAPDGSAVFTRDIGTQEVYALDVKWP
jgi:hypothetical protein